MSSTINVLPAFGNTRILTFVLGQYEHYAFLIGIVLWARQTAEICTEILRQIKFFLLPNINLSKIYVDFDLQIFVKVFPESNIHGTYNNYCRILYHESYEKNVRIVNPSHEEFLKSCFSLILLPHEKIEEGFNELVNNLTHDANVQLTNFIGYFRTTWIQGVGPINMSLFEETDSLNTVPVLFWTSLHNDMGEKPSLWKFFEKLIVTISKFNKELERIKNKKNAYISTAISVRLCCNKNLMIDLWKTLKKSKITLLQFLKTAASYQVDHYHDILHHAEAMEDEQLDIYPQLPEEVEAEVHDNDDQQGIENVEFADYDIENEVVENEDEDMEESGDDEIPQDRCQICIKGPREIIVHPCCHYRMCQVCSKKVQKTAQEKRLPLKCPFCNELAQMFCRVF
ncbi:GSCOCG00012453001-RA-CDS [Cotesia congregata]|nr:GSCOCG00012453001-RA-CDS [Cotesia congregata]